MSEDPIEFLLPWDDVSVQLTIEETRDPRAVQQRLVEQMVSQRVDGKPARACDDNLSVAERLQRLYADAGQPLTLEEAAELVRASRTG